MIWKKWSFLRLATLSDQPLQRLLTVSTWPVWPSSLWSQDSTSSISCITQTDNSGCWLRFGFLSNDYFWILSVVTPNSIHFICTSLNRGISYSIFPIIFLLFCLTNRFHIWQQSYQYSIFKKKYILSHIVKQSEELYNIGD